ncbi:hypothetical protein MVEG_08311 [Podila verticillata NRRL 6337]|nr:hypothetical protein MVEG_08311 [Podila verticillata NRRL 6337]
MGGGGERGCRIAVPLPLFSDIGLGALKNLRESNLYGLNTEIDVEEAEWMMRAWPFLDTICGLLEFSPARIWLEKNHPQLALNRCPFV